MVVRMPAKPSGIAATHAFGDDDDVMLHLLPKSLDGRAAVAAAGRHSKLSRAGGGVSEPTDQPGKPYVQTLVQSPGD